ncbi:MAG: hypothetical protein BRD45_03265 [Bacteroidetes bacterium QS_8_64_10]|nr:MAG: hypothetical protein BRD45_03265 [Bacteroidetes bacterium QS_8_64_10]
MQRTQRPERANEKSPAASAKKGDRETDNEEDARRFKVDFEQQGSDVTVRGEKGDDSSGWFDGWDGDELKVRYRITVPRRYNTDLETAGGSIRVADLEGEVIAETTGGSITARITKQPQESSELSSSAGSVTVYLAEGVGVNVDAETSFGQVESDFHEQRGDDQNELKAAINGGGPELRLRASVGNVQLRRL